MTKRKQTEPRRTRPAPTESPNAHDRRAPANNIPDFSGSVCEEPEQKRFKSDQSNYISPIETACDDTQSPKWQWNISDFRKKHVEFSKELSVNFKEGLNPLELSTSSKRLLGSSKERIETSKDDLESSKECLGGSKGFSHVPKESSVTLESSKESDKASMESPENLKEWTKPSKEMKESVTNSGSNLKGQALESNAGGRFPEKKGPMQLEHEFQNDNMPVILDVFSLSKDFVPGSFLNTPPSTPPLMQLGAFSGMPVNRRNSSFRNEFVQQAFSEQRYGVGNSGFKEREYWYKPVQQVQYNSHVSYPVEQVISQGFQDDPVQRGYRQEYMNKPTHSQEYWNQQAQQVYYNQHGYSSNPVHLVDPPQAYRSNPVQQLNYNPKQIANGVLPLEKSNSKQNVYRMQANTTAFCASYNFADPSKQAPRLKSRVSSESYLVKCRAEGSGVYGRFKLRKFDSREVHDPAAPSVCVQTESDVVHPNRKQARETKIMFSPPAPSIQKHNLDPVNVIPDYSYGIANGYFSVETDEFGRTVFSSTNSVRAENFSKTSEPISRTNFAHTFTDFENHPLNSEKYTTISENSVTITEKDPPISRKQCLYSSGDGPWDKKIVELKQRIEEQEATLRKLRASH